MRTDHQLKHDVTNELEWEPSVNEAHIGVTAKEGIATLIGHVSSYAERYAAEKAAKRVFGVRAVANELDVRLGPDAKRTDEDVAKSCVNTLRAHSLLPSDRIKVIVSDGWVTLEGLLDWQYQKTAAEHSIRYLIGVRGISNNITLNPSVSITDVKDKIQAAFKRSAEIDAKQVQIEARGSKVILRGRVRSLAERNEAVNAAWSAPGVLEVENDLVVTA